MKMSLEALPCIPVSGSARFHLFRKGEPAWIPSSADSETQIFLAECRESQYKAEPPARFTLTLPRSHQDLLLHVSHLVYNRVLVVLALCSWVRGIVAAPVHPQ